MIGRLLEGRYRIQAAAGAGGMAEVYRAVDERDGTFVAVKVARTDRPVSLERFRREARILSEIRHPTIVRYIDFGVTDEGETFLVTDWLEGETLTVRLAAFALDVTEGLLLGLRLADALATLHARGIVHRDLKPSNVLLVEHRVERAVLLDFGIARAEDERGFVTETGAMVGTPGFMAPEQLQGAKNIDARADVFGLGVLLFKALTGELPFQGGDPVAVMMSVLLDTPPRLRSRQPSAPPALDDLLARMLAGARDARPRDGEAVLRELEAIEAPDSSVAPVSRRVDVGLTSTEQQMQSLVLVERGAGEEAEAEPDDVTTVVGGAVPLEPDLKAILDAHGADAHVVQRERLIVSLTAHENLLDLALRAGRCALALAAREPGSRVALVTGRVRAHARADAGSAHARGRELVASATPGSVRLDEPSRALLQGRLGLQIDASGPLLCGELPPGSGSESLLGKATPCFGREREIAALLQLFDEVEGEPVARVALVTGPPGVGKSRLRHELVRALGARAEIWTGRADPLSRGASLHVMAELVRDAVRLEPGASFQEGLSAKLVRGVAPADRARVGTFLGELCGVQSDADDAELERARRHSGALGDQMRLAFEDLLRASLAASPVVLVLEDLHWADAATVQALDRVLRALDACPLFVVALARREVQSAFPKLWEERRLTQFQLGELPVRAARALVLHALGEGARGPEVEALVARSGGNAFYLEELCRAHARGETEGLPDTALAMVGGRFARLDAEARRALRAASVFGQVFWRSGLVALLGGPSRALALDASLATSIAQELVVPRATSRFAGEVELVFRHALLRDAAYATLTREDAVVGHKLAGLWLEQRGEVDAQIIAEHFERGGDLSRAPRFFLRAAQQALGGADLANVIALASRGIEAGAERETRAALESLAAAAHLQRGESAEAEVLGESALQGSLAGSSLWFDAAATVATAAARSGKRARLVEIARAMEETPARDALAEGPRVSALGSTFIQLLRVGEEAVVGGLLEQLSALSERADAVAASGAPALDPAAAAWVHRARAAWSIRGGDFSVFLHWLELAVAAFERAGDPRSACLQRVNAAFVALECGLYEDARAGLEVALRTAERLDARQTAALARNNLGLVLARLGDFDEAVRVERASALAYRSFKDPFMEAAARIYLTTILRDSGDLTGAIEEAETALRVTDVPNLRAYALAALARTLVRAGDGEAALARVREANALPLASAIVEGEAELRLALVEALYAVGARAEAKSALEVAKARLLLRASKISNPAHREGFLGRVPENHETLEFSVD